MSAARRTNSRSQDARSSTLLALRTNEWELRATVSGAFPQRAGFPPAFHFAMIDLALWWQVEARPIIFEKDAPRCLSPYRWR